MEFPVVAAIPAPGTDIEDPDSARDKARSEQGRCDGLTVVLYWTTDCVRVCVLI
jgi:hypothetical protein